jgi:hydroxymethylbilane synthase
MPKFRLGTRGSRLAVAQAEAVKSLLLEAHPGIGIEIVTIKTSGDHGNRDVLGAFVREIQSALLDNHIDAALHCLKDVPTSRVPGLALAAHLKREDPRDAIISRFGGLSDLPPGAVVGTGSLRRTAQLASKRPDLVFRPLVGNVDTRMRKLLNAEYDAIVLAIVGLTRLSLLENWADSEYSEVSVRPLSFEEMLPAPGQGVLVLETRVDDSASQRVVLQLNDADTVACSQAERAFLAAFGSGCSMPSAALAERCTDLIHLTGLIASPDGQTVLRDGIADKPGQSLAIAETLARRLGEKGGYEIVKNSTEPRVGGPA